MSEAEVRVIRVYPCVSRATKPNGNKREMLKGVSLRKQGDLFWFDNRYR